MVSIRADDERNGAGALTTDTSSRGAFVPGFGSSGHADAAVAWLASIPARFRPAELAADRAFASLRSRSDFRALFERR